MQLKLFKSEIRSLKSIKRYIIVKKNLPDTSRLCSPGLQKIILKQLGSLNSNRHFDLHSTWNLSKTNQEN